MNILFVEADEPQELSTSTWLCRIPAAAINRAGKGKHQAQVIYRNLFVQGQFDIGWPDLIVVERLLVTPINERIKECQSHGKKILARFDDNYALMPAYISSSLLWRRNLIVKGEDKKNKTLLVAKMQQSMLNQFREGLRICDAASTPSRLLCQDYERYAKKMYYIPNFPDLGNPAWTAPKPKHEGIIIGWGGGGTHLQSIRDSNVLTALQLICREFDQVKVMICGNETYAKEKLAEILPRERLITQAWVPTEQWPYTVANFDIGLAPLAGNYDDRRSWVKVLDYAILGIPFVASDRPPYEGCHGGIKVKNKGKDWYRAIRTFIVRPSAVEVKVNAGRTWSWRTGIDSNINHYFNVFEEILKG